MGWARRRRGAEWDGGGGVGLGRRGGVNEAERGEARRGGVGEAERGGRGKPAEEAGESRLRACLVYGVDERVLSREGCERPAFDTGVRVCRIESRVSVVTGGGASAQPALLARASVGPGASRVSAVGAVRVSAVGASRVSAVGASRVSAVGESRVSAVGAVRVSAVGASRLSAVGVSRLSAV